MIGIGAAAFTASPKEVLSFLLAGAWSQSILIGLVARQSRFLPVLRRRELLRAKGKPSQTNLIFLERRGDAFVSSGRGGRLCVATARGRSSCRGGGEGREEPSESRDVRIVAPGMWPEDARGAVAKQLIKLAKRK